MRYKGGSDHGVRFSRANASMKLKKYADAISDLDVVIKMRPEHARAYSLRAEAYERLGKTDKAKQDRLAADKIGDKFWGLKE